MFCITCNTTICHRCALFDSSAHCGHSFRPIEEIYNDTLAQLGENCDNLKTKGELIKNDIKEIVCIYYYFEYIKKITIFLFKAKCCFYLHYTTDFLF